MDATRAAIYRDTQTFAIDFEWVLPVAEFLARKVPELKIDELVIGDSEHVKALTHDCHVLLHDSAIVYALALFAASKTHDSALVFVGHAGIATRLVQRLKAIHDRISPVQCRTATYRGAAMVKNMMNNNTVAFVSDINQSRSNGGSLVIFDAYDVEYEKSDQFIMAVRVLGRDTRFVVLSQEHRLHPALASRWSLVVHPLARPLTRDRQRAYNFFGSRSTAIASVEKAEEICDE